MIQKTFIAPLTNAAALQDLFRGLAIRRFRGKQRRGKAKSPKVAFVYPTKRGSLGDEALLLGALGGLKQCGDSDCALVSFSRDDTWEDLPPEVSLLYRPIGWPLRWFGFCRALAEFDAIGVIGADVIDGYYSPRLSCDRIDLANTGAALGLRSAILGFSYRRDPNPRALAHLRKVRPEVQILARDPASKRNLEKTGTANVQLTADLAFLMQPAAWSRRVQEALAWISERKGNGEFVLGANCNRQVLRDESEVEISKLISAYSDTVVRMGKSHPYVSFVLLPHDCRGRLSDLELARRLHSRLDPEHRSRCLLIDELWTAPEIKAVAAAVDMVVTGRMHLAIAALGMGVPVVSLTYQDKFEGLYEHFEMPLAGAPGEDALKDGVLFKLIKDGIRDVDSSRMQVRRRLPSVVALARRNIEILLGNQPT